MKLILAPTPAVSVMFNVAMKSAFLLAPGTTTAGSPTKVTESSAPSSGGGVAWLGSTNSPSPQPAPHKSTAQEANFSHLDTVDPISNAGLVIPCGCMVQGLTGSRTTALRPNFVANAEAARWASSLVENLPIRTESRTRSALDIFTT